MIPILIIGGIVIVLMLIIFALGVIWVFYHPIETTIIISLLAVLAYLYKSPHARKKIKKALT